MNKTINKILVIRASSIGDILLTTPLLRVLRQRFQNARIDFLIKKQFYDLLRTNPNIDRIHALDTRGGTPTLATLRKELKTIQYDLVIDIHNNFRSQYLRKIPNAQIVRVKKYKWPRFFLVAFGWNFYRHVVPVYKRYIDTVSHLEIADDGLGLDFFPDPAVQIAIKDKLRDMGYRSARPTVCLAPGASFATKRWPIENFTQVAKRISDEFKVQLLLLGDTTDAALTQRLSDEIGHSVYNLAGQLNLMESACALSFADAMLTNDTGLMHLATALKKPTVAIFGSTVKELGFYPVGEKSFVIENEGLSCRPCSHIGRKSCPQKHFRCMQEIGPDRVLALFSRFLA